MSVAGQLLTNTLNILFFQWIVLHFLKYIDYIEPDVINFLISDEALDFDFRDSLFTQHWSMIGEKLTQVNFSQVMSLELTLWSPKIEQNTSLVKTPVLCGDSSKLRTSMV